MNIFSPESPPPVSSLAYAARPAQLRGLRIGLLDNTKAPVDKMMAHLERRLREAIPGSQPFYIAKGAVNRPAEAAVLDALVSNADVIVNALGS